MFKKLGKLLFEDEEDDEYEYEDETEEVEAAPKKAAAPQRNSNNTSRPVNNNQGYQQPRQEPRRAPSIELTQSFERLNYNNNSQQQQTQRTYNQQPQTQYNQQRGYAQQNMGYAQQNVGGYPQQSANYPQQNSGYAQQNSYNRPQTAYANNQFAESAYQQNSVQPQYSQQPQPVQNQSSFAQRPQPNVLPNTDVRAFGQETSIPERRQPSINIDNYIRPVQEVSVQPQQAEPEQQTKKQVMDYEFRPVISPIFGVDEKDLSALKTAGTSTSGSSNAHVAEIISPIYGMSIDAQPSSIQKTVAKSNAIEEYAATPASKEAEDEIPEISLDDLIRSKDDDFMESSVHTSPVSKSVYAEENAVNNQNEIDQTTVINKDDVSFPSLRIDE